VAEWYVWQETGPAGPLSNQDLARSIKAEEIGPDDWLWHDRLGEWTVAGTIDFLWSRTSSNAPGGAGDDTSRTHDKPTVAQITRTTTGAVETPSLTELYLRRLKMQRGRETAEVQAGAKEFIDDLAAASVDGAETVPSVANHNATEEAGVYLRQMAQEERERAERPGEPPPLPGTCCLTTAAAARLVTHKDFKRSAACSRIENLLMARKGCPL